MITLTTPALINSILGGTQTVSYEKLVIGPFTMDGVTQTINGTLRLTSTSNPSMQPIQGRISISVATAELVLEVQQLDFYRRIVLNGAQNTAVLAIIEAAQKGIEDGLVTLAVIAGTRTVGA